MQEKKTETPTQNIQMMKVESRNQEPSVNILTRSGAKTSVDKAEGNHTVANVWVQKSPEKKDLS